MDYSKKESNKNLYLHIKRFFDLFFSLFAIIILFPFFIIISLVIYIDDPYGSPIYVQTRVGINGEEFKMLKFRSMYHGAEKDILKLFDKNEMDGPAFKIENDPRATRVGRVIRKTCIDELPQVFNVLIGNMSIVGPRPALPDEVKQYKEIEKQRLKIKPGMTCIWQTTNNKNSLSFDEWVKLDIFYMNNMSLKNDVKIICKTIKIVCRSIYKCVFSDNR